MSKPDTPARWLRGVLTVLVGSLFALSFWENWAALTHAAVQGHIPHPGPWPWMVDGFILAMALMAVLASMERRSVWWPRTGMVGSTALSLAVVVSHAPAAHGGQWLAAWSPVAVLFSFECLMWLVFGARRTVVHAPGPVVPERAPALPLLTPEELEQLDERLTRIRLLTQVSRNARRALALGATVVDLTFDEWVEVLEEHEHACAYCGVSDVPLTMDHKVPVSKGGEHTKANVAPACGFCNTSKGAQTEAEWRGVHISTPPEPEPVVPLLTRAEQERIRRRLHKGLDVQAIVHDTGLDAHAVQACVDKLTQSNGHKADA